MAQNIVTVPVDVALIVMIASLGLFSLVVLCLIAPQAIRDAVRVSRSLFPPPDPLSADQLAEVLYLTFIETTGKRDHTPWHQLEPGTRVLYQRHAQNIIRDFADRADPESFEERRRLNAVIAMSDRSRRLM
jgi:hypothetical protein